jgi:hypothetical protein
MSVGVLLKALRAEILEIAKLHGATNVRVFGSPSSLSTWSTF